MGSSGRIFPRTFKASPLLRAWLAQLGQLGVDFRLRHRWQGWDGRPPRLYRFGRRDGLGEARRGHPGLGGASWPGSAPTGTWTPLLAERGIAVSPLRPSNMGFVVSGQTSCAAVSRGNP